jgi:hypothetical protein
MIIRRLTEEEVRNIIWDVEEEEDIVEEEEAGFSEDV